MNFKTLLRNQSSYLVRLPVIAALLLLGLAAAYLDAGSLAAVLLLLFLVGFTARLWTHFAARHVTVSVRADAAGVFPGHPIHLHYIIENRKTLPLIWLDLFQPLPDPVCLTPEDPGELREMTALEQLPFTPKTAADAPAAPPTHRMAVEKRFSLILWHQRAEFDTCWNAVRRGLLRLTDATASTGDGFGLTQAEWPLQLSGTGTIAVYPQPAAVQLELFLHDLSEAENGALGTYEDVTVVRATRPYQPTDPAKRINWRLAARQIPTPVNVYETILPRAALLLFDGESFGGAPGHAEALEETLSILTGIVLGLAERGVRCTLSMPDPQTPAVLTQTADMLYRMAAYRVSPPVFSDDEPRRPIPVTAHFDTRATVDAARRAGRVYYLCYDAAALSNPILRQLPTVTALCYVLPETPDPAHPVLALQNLRGGAAHA